MADQLSFDDLFDPSLKRQMEDLQKNTKDYIKLLNTDLANSFQKVQEESKQLSGQLDKQDAATSQGRKNIENTAKSVSNLAAQEAKLVQSQREVSKATDATNNSIKQLKDNLKAQRTEFENLDRSTAKGQKRYKELTQEIGRTQTEIKAVNLELRKSQQQFEAQSREVRSTAKSYDDLQNESRSVLKQLKTMDNAVNQVTGEWNEQDPAVKKLVGRYKEIQNVLKSTDSQLGNFQRGVGDYNNSIQQAISGLGGQGGLAGSFGQLGNAANTVLPDIGNGLTSIVGKLGPAGLAAGALGAAFVGAFDKANDLAREIGPQLQSVRALIGGTDEEVRNLTASIRATSKAFDREFNEVLRAVNANTEAFGITGEESLGLINSALIQGFDLNQDLLDQLGEYSVQFAAAGFSAESFFAVQRIGARQGIFNDKAADTVKEFGLRIRELTPATELALKPLGEYTNEQIRLAVESGDTAKALEIVAGGLSDVELSAQQTQTIIADVFGGPGEDAGLEFIKSLRNINGEFKTLEELVENADGTLNEFQQSQAEILLLNQEFERSQVDIAAAFGATGDAFAGFTTQAKTFFNDVLARGIVEFRLFAATVKGFFEAISDGDFTGISDRVEAERVKVLLAISQAQDRELEQQEEFNKKRAAEQLDADRKLGLDRVKIQAQIQNLLLDREIGFQQEVLDNDESGAGARVAALLRIGQMRIMQEQNTLNAILQDQDLSQQEREKELIAHQNRIIDIEREFGNRIRDVRAEQDALLRSVEQADFLSREKNQADFQENILAQGLAAGERLKAQNERDIKNFEEQQARRQEIQNAVFDGLQAGLEASFELRNAAIDAQFQSELDALQIKQQAELDAAGENEEAKAVIAARFEEQRRALEAERARKDKQNAIFEATINTAVAIARALGSAAPPLNFIAAGIAAVQGAAQIAAIAATPIPKFEKGTKSSPEGLAMVGEAGPELIKDPSGELSLATDPGLQFLKRGSRVYTADETRALADAAIMEGAGDTIGTAADAVSNPLAGDLKDLISDVQTGRLILLEAVKSMSSNHFEVSERGLKVYTKNQGNRTDYFNKRYNSRK